MNKFMLNITASSGEFYQGDCEDLVLPTGDGVYGVQAGHNPVLVAIQMGILHFEVNGEARDILVGDGIAEVTPAYVPRRPASVRKSACSTRRACMNIIRARSHCSVPCSVCRLHPSTSAET